LALPGMSSSENAVRDCLAELAQRVDGDVRSDRYSRILYSTDASIYQVEPHGVLIPRSSDDVQAALEIAGKWSVPVLARTSGTSLAGQAVNRALVLDMTRYLDRVLEIDADNRRVRVEPGVVLDDLNSRLRPFGLQFGPDPASSDRAALGGIVSNNSTGAHSVLYGMTADHVQEMTVVLSDGSTAKLGPTEAGRMQELRRRGGLEGEICGGEGWRVRSTGGSARWWKMKDIGTRCARELRDIGVVAVATTWIGS